MSARPEIRRKEKTTGGKTHNTKKGQNVSTDELEMSLDGLTIRLKRYVLADVPVEFHMILPRVEYRETFNEREIILNSLTIVSAPRHPPTGERPLAVSPRPKQRVKNRMETYDRNNGTPHQRSV